MLQRFILQQPLAVLDPAFLTITTEGEGETWATWAMPGEFHLVGRQVLYVVDDADLTPEQQTLVQRSLA